MPQSDLLVKGLLAQRNQDMKRSTFMKLRLLILSVALSFPVIVVAQSLDTAKIDEAMGRSGQQTGDVYRLGFPRTDLHVSVGGVEIKPGLALEPKPPWRERKEQYLTHLLSASTDALLVSIADKLHNARSVLADYRRHKENVWMRFSEGKKEQFWYYGELVKVFTQRRPEDALVTEFARVVTELKGLG
jgi:hypothetical protein